MHLVELVVVPVRRSGVSGPRPRSGTCNLRSSASLLSCPNEAKALDIQHMPFAAEPACQEVLLRAGRGLVHGVSLAADAFQPWWHWFQPSGAGKPLMQLCTSSPFRSSAPVKLHPLKPAASSSRCRDSFSDRQPGCNGTCLQ